MNKKRISSVRMKLALLELAERLNSVSEACRLLGYSRQSFYRFQRIYEAQGPEGLQQATRKRRPLAKNRLSEQVEAAVLAMGRQHPTDGAERIAARLREMGHVVSGGGVRGIWTRHKLTTASRRIKRAARKIEADAGLDDASVGRQDDADVPKSSRG